MSLKFEIQMLVKNIPCDSGIFFFSSSKNFCGKTHIKVSCLYAISPSSNKEIKPKSINLPVFFFNFFSYQERKLKKKTNLILKI